MAPGKLDIAPFSKALTSLKKVLKLDANDEVVRDAAIQRFEYTYELSWKMMERHINWARAERQGAPLVRKELFREAARYGLVSDPVRWFDHQEARNATSHAYDENKARAVFAAIPAFVVDADHLLKALRESHA